MADPAPAMSKPRAWLVLGVLAVGFAVFLYSEFARDFLPSPDGFDAALAGGAMLGLWAAAAALRTPQRGSDSRKSNPVVRMLALGLFAAMFGFYVLMNGVEQLYTRLAGAPVTRGVMVSGWHSQHRRSCGGPELASYPWSSGLCLSSDWRARLPRGTPLTLHGIGSPLGVEVESLQMADGTTLPL